MKKPHEEDWETDFVSIRAGGQIVASFDNHQADRQLPQQKKRARLAARAPKMARLLLEIREAGTDYSQELQDEVAVILRDAGVVE